MISLIDRHLQEKQCYVTFFKDDANVLIVKEAAEVSQHCDMIVVEEDTDFLHFTVVPRY